MNFFFVSGTLFLVHCCAVYRRYFQHAHFIPIVGVGKRKANINWSIVTCQGSTRSELP